MEKVSIITPVFNRLDLLMDTAQSVLSLNSENWEWILVDDGSGPEVLKFLDELQAKHKNIIAASRDKNKKGAPTCRNKGIEIAQYDYLLFLDSDDLLSPDSIDLRLDVIKRNPFNDFWVFPVGLFSNTPHDLLLFQNLKDERKDLDRFCFGENVWQTLGVVWKKSYIKSIGGFEEGLPSFQDWELSIRAIINAEKYYYHMQSIPDAFYRITEGDSISLKRYDEKNAIGNAEMILDIFGLLIKNNTLTEQRRLFLLNFFISRLKFWSFIETKLNRDQMIRTFINKAHSISLISTTEELKFINDYFFKKSKWFDRLFRKGNVIQKSLEESPIAEKYFVRKNILKKYTYQLNK